LLYIAQSANVALGGAALFTLALGMGAPLLVFAAGARSLLPKAGTWMQALSAVFGFMMVAVALWVVSPVAPVSAMLLAWAILAALCGSACWHCARAEDLRAQVSVLFAALGGLAWLLALVYVLGFFSSTDSALRPLQPLLSVSGKVAKATSALPFETVSSSQVLQVLAHSKQPVMLDFYADWCVACKEMELLTFSQAPVQQALVPLRLLKVDMTQNTAADLALLQHFGLFGPPALLFFSAGSAQPVQRVIGFQNTETFLQTLGGVLPRLGQATNDDKTRS
jgi:thiol:disulfide interchange protein DsbD